MDLEGVDFVPTKAVSGVLPPRTMVNIHAFMAFGYHAIVYVLFSSSSSGLRTCLFEGGGNVTSVATAMGTREARDLLPIRV